MPLLQTVSPDLLLRSFYKGFRLDLSMVGYLIAIPFLLTTAYYILRKKFAVHILDFFNYSLILVYVLTIVGEALLYREWRSKLSTQALQHFLNPTEVFKSASTGLTVLFFGLSVLLSFIFISIYKRKISLKRNLPLKKETIPNRLWKGFLFLLVSVAFSAISIRGGLQAIPIQCSDATFCTQAIANDAAINPLWNITFNILEYENHTKENPFKDFKQAEADNIVKKLYAAKSDSTEIFLKKQRPNIVFIIMESWSATVIKSFGGDDFAPFMDSLSKQGIKFTKIYPPAYVSDQGIPSVLSGYPSVSRISIIHQSSKSMKLPSINQDLKKYGYQSGFVFGGDLNYGNIRSYIYNKAFDVVKEEKDFGNELNHGKLGIQDGDMQAQYIQLLNKARPPFVYAWFTLSTHMPYDYPGEKKQLVSHQNEYVNSVIYSDNAFRQFFTDAKKQPWYKNTLFVLVADHSHASHKEFSVYDPEYHHIPLIFFGDVIKDEWRGKTIDAVFSQMDVPATLLAQMGLKNEAKQYVWSKNMFDPKVNHFAYFCSFEGGGMVSDNACVGYQHSYKDLIINRTPNKQVADSLTKMSKAFQQSVYEDYRLK